MILGQSVIDISPDASMLDFMVYDDDDLASFKIARVSAGFEDATTHTGHFEIKVATSENPLEQAVYIDSTKKTTLQELAFSKTEEFNTAGGLKSNIKLTFQYEFLLRFLTNASKIYTVPKIGYKHLTIREGSLFDTIAKTMDMKERQFWFETAKKEANFFNDRPIDFHAFEATKNEPANA